MNRFIAVLTKSLRQMRRDPVGLGLTLLTPSFFVVLYALVFDNAGSRPTLVVLASLDTPRGFLNQGGDVAAPLFARVARHALRALAVPPDDADRVLRAVGGGDQRLRGEPASPTSTEPGIMPDLQGRSAREAAIAAARQGLVVELRGSGRVVDQTPAPGTVVEAGLTCRLTLSRTGGPR